MTSLSLQDAIQKAGLNVKDVLLIRHPISNSKVQKYVDKGCLLEYTAAQSPNFQRKEKYWLVFLGETGTSAKLTACYLADGFIDRTPETMPLEFSCPEFFEENFGYYYHLKNADLFSDLIDRLVVDWGTGTRSWYQSATNDKPILAIQERERLAFKGFEDLILCYADLKEIINDPIRFSNWHTALKSVYAIYLISDTKTGKLYVGSAYGKDGLFARWKCYVDTHTGNNKGMIDTISVSPNQYRHFQFAILQIIPKVATAEDVISLESLYKRKMLSRQFGMNQN